jgi:hypothetical protein
MCIYIYMYNKKQMKTRTTPSAPAGWCWQVANIKVNSWRILGPTWWSPTSPLRDDVGKLPTSKWIAWAASSANLGIAECSPAGWCWQVANIKVNSWKYSGANLGMAKFSPAGWCWQVANIKVNSWKHSGANLGKPHLAIWLLLKMPVTLAYHSSVVSSDARVPFLFRMLVVLCLQVFESLCVYTLVNLAVYWLTYICLVPS